MDFADAKVLLSRVALLDNRQVDAATITMWMEVFQPYTLSECLWALRQFARTNVSEYLRPAHLIAIINLKRVEYRMMNPSARFQPDAWLTFEDEQEMIAGQVRELRASGIRSAIEAANDPGLDS